MADRNNFFIDKKLKQGWPHLNVDTKSLITTRGIKEVEKATLNHMNVKILYNSCVNKLVIYIKRPHPKRSEHRLHGKAANILQLVIACFTANPGNGYRNGYDGGSHKH
jgi:hypothetical protein